jgi:pilus assembly protein CpaF
MTAAFNLNVQVGNDPVSGSPFEMAPGKQLVVGRKQPADVVIALPEVSSRHAAIRLDPATQTVKLVDLNSKQGTYVNAKPLAPNQECDVKPGDLIQVGRAHLRVHPVVQAAAAGNAPQATMMMDAGGAPAATGTGADNTTGHMGPAATSVVPQLTPEEIQTLAAKGRGRGNEEYKYDSSMTREIQEILLRRVDLARIVRQAGNDDEAREVVRKQIGYVVNELYRKGRVRQGDVPKLEKDAFDDILGLGPIQDLMDDHTVSEIMVNRFNQIYYEKSGKLKLMEGRTFMNDEHVLQILQRLLRESSRRIDESNPRVNATLADGSRLHAIIPPLALNGSTITIRKFHHNLALEDLIKYGALTKSMGKFLELAVYERQNIIVSGGTGSGKTTLLNCLSSFIPEDQRVVTIEDTAELQLKQPHVVRLQARPANAEGVGLVSIEDLVVESLRMRPDRVIVGECRHGEALDMLQAMNTGHDGSLTTVHANNAADALHRLETMVLMSGLELPMRAIREQIASAVHLIVQASRLVDGSRRITEIIEVTGINEGEVQVQSVYKYLQKGLTDSGKIIGNHEPSGYIPRFLGRMREQGKKIPPDLFSV